MKISLLVNVLNEEKNLEANISNLSGSFDEIVIVDMVSDDGTKEVAEGFATKVISVERMGYVEPARKIGIDACENDHILILDADEKPSEELLKEIGKLRKGEASLLKPGVVNFIPRLNNMMGKEVIHGQFKPDSDKQLRFFDRRTVTVTSIIHKGLTSKGEVNSILFNSGVYIYHFHSDSAIEFVSRLVRYCQIEGTGCVGKDSFTVTKTIRAFVKEYFKYKGFLNGRHGFALAFILSIREFINGK